MDLKFGIAISTYDKFDELAVLHDIFRHNFSHKFYLYLCSNHPSAEIEIKKRGLIFDGFVKGENIEYNSQLDSISKRVAIVCRSTDTVQKSCTLAMQSTDFVMHIHCDAWPLDENSLVSHFNNLIESHYDMAVRGLGYSASRDDAPLGHVDDHFFVFNSKVAREVNLFDFRPLHLLPHKLSVHGILMAQFLIKLGRSRILFFDIFSRSSLHDCWSGEVKKFPSFPVKPSLIDKERGFIHIHTESFPNDFGRQLQVFYLKQYNLANGINLSSYLANYQNAPDLNLVLSKELKRMTLLTRLLGYDVGKFGQDVISMRQVVSKASLKEVVLNYAVKIADGCLSLLRLKLTRKTKSIWPMQISDYYKENVNNEVLRSISYEEVR